MVQQASGAGGKEKRRHVRRATRQSALIRFTEGVAARAEIRDYCQTGLYLAYVEEKTPDAALAALVGTPLRVEFTVAGGTGSLFRLDGRVAHVCSDGMGVYVAGMLEGALQALRMAGAGHAPQACGPAGDAARSPQRTQTLQQECTGLFRAFLDQVLQDFFGRGAERLSEASQDQVNFLERSRYLQGAQELTQCRARIQENYFSALRERMPNVRPATETAPDTPVADDLAIVDEAEFEDWLNLSSVLSSLEADVAPQLDDFEQRYALLLGMPIGRKNNPFGPDVLCRAFREAIRPFDFSNPMRGVLYKAFGLSIARHVGSLYQKLNQALASLQPAPPVRPARDKTRPEGAPAHAGATEARTASSPTEAGKRTSGAAEIADWLLNLYQQNQASVPQDLEGAEYSLDRILLSLNQPRRRPAGPPAVAAGNRDPRMGALGRGTTGYPVVLPMVDSLRQASRQLLGAAAVRGGQPVGETGRGKASLPEAGLGELLAALDELPVANQSLAVGAAALPALTEQLNERLAMAAGGPRSLGPAHRYVLDTTSSLIGQARAEFLPSSEVESLVKRLDRPLMKLALKDDCFPTFPDHPARQVVNLLDQCAVAADDQGKFFDGKLQRFLSLLVDRVCSRADEDPGIFATVRDSLEKILLPIQQARRARVARLQEASEGRERIRTARSRVNDALEQRLAGREVPGVLLRLLDAGWRQYLVLSELRQGCHGEEWQEGLAVLDRLSAWVVPHGSTSRSAKDAQALLDEIERKLATVSVDKSLMTAVLDELRGLVAGGEAQACPPPTMVAVPLGKLAKMEAGGGQSAPNGLLERLRIGDWWYFSMAGKPIPMQLIWVSLSSSSCTFANRSATNKLELTRTELAKQVESGYAKPGKDLDLPLLDRSEYALFDETYQRLVHQVMHDPVTGLLNRKGFMQRLNHRVMAGQSEEPHTVCIIEFDQLRTIYNTCGVEAAEGLAHDLASAIQGQIGPDGVLAAFRDDTLALLLPNCRWPGSYHVAENVLNHTRDYRFQHAQHSYSIGLSIGLAEYAPDSVTAAEAVRRADSACLTAKALGRNRIQVYEQAGAKLKNQVSLMDWAGRIDSFLKGSGLYLRCQKVAPIGPDDTLLPYFEVLLGIKSESGAGAVSPMHFILAVERLKRSHEVDIWVLKKVFEWIRANRRGFASVGGFAVNLSATSLSNPEVIGFLHHTLPQGDIPTEKIIFEITEISAVESYASAQEFIRQFGRYGCRFALDDFGSGFTSYAHLKNLHTDTLKIDGSFVKDMLQNPSDYAMVKSMNDIAHSLGQHTVAEFAETPTILNKLREIGVDYAQGYAIHKPCPIDEILPG